MLELQNKFLSAAKALCPLCLLCVLSGKKSTAKVTKSTIPNHFCYSHQIAGNWPQRHN